MPRISVDIDLTYLPIEDKSISFKNIAAALERIKSRLEALLPTVRVLHKQDSEKLLISKLGVDIKLEVSLVKRSILEPPQTIS